MNKQTKALQGN